MEIYIEVQDNKAELIIKLLERLPFVEIKAVKAHKEQQPAKPANSAPERQGHTTYLLVGYAYRLRTC